MRISYLPLLISSLAYSALASPVDIEKRDDACTSSWVDSILTYNWGDRYYDYKCIVQTWGGESTAEKSTCASIDFSISGGGKVLASSLGISYQQCLTVGHTCTHAEDMYSKLFFRTQKQPLSGRVRMAKKCRSGLKTWEKDYSSTVVWSARYECHYEDNENGNCPSG
ncbi:hypothetical protein BGZ76_003486 [Entomortierella beljakovae]|nr:hypothetical protein BGZ76_003486 [Entomortierella beljakovae]